MAVSQPVMLRSTHEDAFSNMADGGRRQIEDDEETVLDIKHDYVPYDDTGRKAYENACKKLGVVPSSQYIRALASSDCVNLSHYGLGPRGAIAVCIPLVINMKVSVLNLSNNHLGIEGIQYVRKMMMENDTIKDLNLANNNLGAYGAREIALMLTHNSTIKYLNISGNIIFSGNGLRDEEAGLLLHSIEEHMQLESVNLSHNKFCELSGDYFQSLLSDNSVLEELDLSWNNIRRDCAIKIANGIKENRGILKLNISWNGFEDEGAIAIASALRDNKTLEALDVHCNRIGPEGFLALSRSFQVNSNLICLKAGKNFFTEETVAAAISYFSDLSDLVLQTLDLTGVILGHEVQAQVEEFKSSHENFECMHGYEHSFGKKKSNDNNVIGNIIQMLTEHLQLTNRSFADLFQEIDTDGSMTVSCDEFKEGFKDAAIPITPFQVDELIRYLDKDNDGEIDFSELVFMG